MSSRPEQKFVISREHKIANRNLDGIWIIIDHTLTPVVDETSGLDVLHVNLVDEDDAERMVWVPTHWVKKVGW